MTRSLVIVESPAKAKTIGKFLGRGFVVKATMGHLRDLPRSQFGVDVNHCFAPKYITIRGRGKQLKELRDAVKKADRIFLATDPDREGEAISWHLAEALGIPVPEAQRIEFHEITKRAIQEAVKKPRAIDMNLVNAQQARRILDRLVGYKLSPLLWSKIRKGLSAGRVQSVAVRLVVDREDEINAFISEEYWTVEAELKTARGDSLTARLVGVDGSKASIGNSNEADGIARRAEKAHYTVTEVRRRERLRNPAAPFTTSSLQQEASRRMGFAARKTMSLAQQLYEGLDLGEEGTVGLISYIRTDSTRVSTEAQAEAREYIERAYGKEYMPETPPQYKTKQAQAQEAHEAIRPTSIMRLPEEVKPHLTRDQYRLYRLVWERFVASQMASAVMDSVTVEMDAAGLQFRATGQTVKFPGFLTLYAETTDDEKGEEKGEEQGLLPELAEGETLKLKQVDPHQHFTQPPARYTEAMLVRTLEEKGIGRPSTYAPIIETVLKRRYVVLEQKRFHPTELGEIVVRMLEEHFPRIIDVEFTAQMEEQLDQVEEGAVDWVKVLGEFYGPFEGELEQAEKTLDKVAVRDEESDEVCELCGRRMVYKYGRFGKFLACPGFPECRNTKPVQRNIGVDCPVCGAPIAEKRSKKGRTFYGCTAYPQCSFVAWDQPSGEKCPKCGEPLVIKKNQGKPSYVRCLGDKCDYRLKIENHDDDES